MSILECDIVRGMTYKRFFLNPIHNSTTLSVVLINRKHNSKRSIVNEQEIIDMLTFVNQKHMVFSFFHH